tara:strand:+ start:161 stop:1414 length:1254 start_codon:yes stop_codon:yes gene_type:complete
LKKQSLSERADIFPVKIYGEQISEIPNPQDKGVLTYFGSSCYLRLLETRRKQMNLIHSKENTLAIENDNYFVTSCKSKTSSPATYVVKGYDNHIKEGLNKDVKWAVRNVPYNDESTNNGTPLWQDLIEADNKNGVLEFQSDVLPTSLERGSATASIRKRYFDDFGLYKVRTIPFDAFKEWGADVATGMYFCRKGYAGDITVKTDIETYTHDFQKEGFIVTPDTKSELDFILSCVYKPSYDFSAPKLVGLGGKRLKGNVKKLDIFSLNKTDTFKYPLLCEMRADKNVLGYTSTIVDPDWDKDRLVIPNYTGGWDGGKREMGVVKYLPAGIQLPANSYKYMICDPTKAKIHAMYLMSTYVKYLQYIWKVQRTNDAPQLRVIPELTDFTVQTDDDILEFLGGTLIKKEIIDGYSRKIAKK